MKRPSLQQLVFWIGLCLLTILCDTAQAQRRGRGSELDLLRREEVLQEIGVSNDVLEQIDALRQNSTSSPRAIFNEYREKIKAAESDEEVDRIRQEMRDAVSASGREFQQAAIRLLSPAQQKQLRRVFIENNGVFALRDDRVASDLQLTDEQREQIQNALEQRRELRRQNDLSEDERTQQLETSEQTILAILSDQQRQTWQEQAAIPAAVAAEDATPPPTPATAPEPSKENEDQPNVAETTPAAPTAAPAMTAPQNPGQADFGRSESASSPDTSRTFSFNFSRTPWERVLQMLADISGLTLDMQRVPPGTLSHRDSRQYTSEQTLDIINGYLIRKGFAVVRKDGFLVVVNLDEQLDQSLIPEVTREQLLSTGDQLVVGDNQLVTIRVPMEGLETARIAQEIEALLGPWGSMIALTQSELIMVTDIGANLRRIVGLLDNATRPDEQLFQSYHLRHIDVEDAEPLLLTQFGMRQGATNVSSSAESQRSRSRRSRDDRNPQPAPAPPSPDALQVASDVRTNSLLVTGTAAQHALVKEILQAVDVSEAPDGRPLSRTGRRGKYLTVYDVSSSDAREVTKTLDAIMPGVVVNEDGRNGKIHIMATEREHQEVAQLIRQLDGAGGQQSVAVIPLSTMDPLAASVTLQSLFSSEGDTAPTIETDLYGRRLIVRGEPLQVTQIKAVLAQLGEDGSGQRNQNGNRLRRRYSLQGRSPNDFLKLLQQTWQDAEPHPIRIVVPSRNGPLRERRTLDGAVDDMQEHSDEAASPAEDQEPADNAPKTSPAAAEDDPAAADNGIATDYVPVAIANDDDQDTPPAEVVITVLGDDLLLTSQDADALDRLEDLLDSLQQTIPYRTRWTIFYLQSADATEAADLLAQLFPSSSVASTAASSGGSLLGSLANSMSGIGSSLADATGLSSLSQNPRGLQIIPDVRSNSLLIAGPESLLQDVWTMLNVLDSDDIPESFRDMEQRTIQVQHADIDNVAGILRDVYRPLLEAQGSGNSRGRNPLAAMFGGGGQDNQASETPVRMTLGVDRQTSSLVVSSSRQIYDDVRELVETLDKNAADANRRIRVVRLKNADPLMVQQSLTSLFPRVSTSISTSRTSGTGSSSSGAGDQNAQQRQEQQQRDEAIRRWRERMEQRQNQSGGNNNRNTRNRRNRGGGSGRTRSR